MGTPVPLDEQDQQHPSPEPNQHGQEEPFNMPDPGFQFNMPDPEIAHDPVPPVPVMDSMTEDYWEVPPVWPSVDNLDLETLVWNGMEHDNGVFANPEFHNFHPDYGTTNGVLGAPSPWQDQPPNPAPYAPIPYVPFVIPGNQGHPWALDANMRNLHTNEFLLALSREGMRWDPSSGLHVLSLRQALRLDVRSFKAQDLDGDCFDIQGLSWNFLRITRRTARRRRMETYVNHTNIRGGDMKSYRDNVLPSHDNFFRFRKLDALDNTRVAHFQLRNLLVCPNRSQAFYTASGGLRCINPITGLNAPALKVPRPRTYSCLTADFGLLMAGALDSSYAIRRLDGKPEDAVEGQLTRLVGGGLNHLEMYSSRLSDSPCVGICSNDKTFTVMDLRTQAILSARTTEKGPFNCSAISQDGRLRALVGDQCPVLISDATSGDVIHTLTGHTDYGFSCAWSDDGWTLATGGQDRKICIWDARKWCGSNGGSLPLVSIRSEMAAVRTLKYSPAGSGKPVLVAAEGADFVNIIDAQTYGSKQTIDIFGDIGGVDFTNGGRNLNVFCCDPNRGSLMQLERCGQAVEPLLEKPQDIYQEVDLRSTWDPRRTASRERPFPDLVQEHVDAF